MTLRLTKKPRRVITQQGWIDGVAHSLGDGYVSPGVPSNSGILITGFTAIGVAQNSWKWDTQSFVLTGSAPNQYVKGDQMARFKLLIPPDVTDVDVRGVSTAGVGGAALGFTVDPAINGVAVSNGSLVYTTPGVNQTQRVNVPGSGTRTLDLYEQGCYITGLTPIGGSATMTLIPASAPAKSLLAVGASGTRGFYSWDPTNVTAGVGQFILSWLGRFKTSGRWDAIYCVASDGFGLQNHVNSTAPTTGQIATWLTSTVLPRCNGTSEITIIYEFGAGDYFNAIWSAAQITTYYGMVADQTHAALPGARIFFKTPIICSSPAEGTVNAVGITMQDVRDAIVATAVGRPFVTIIPGYAGGSSSAETQNTGQLQDGKHATPVAMRDTIFPYDFSVVS